MDIQDGYSVIFKCPVCEYTFDPVKMAVDSDMNVELDNDGECIFCPIDDCKWVCFKCIKTCSSCARTLCLKHMRKCKYCNQIVCSDCQEPLCIYDNKDCKLIAMKIY